MIICRYLIVEHMQCDYKESILKRDLFTFILGNDTILKRKPFIPVAEESKQQKELLVDQIPLLNFQMKNTFIFFFPYKSSIFH